VKESKSAKVNKNDEGDIEVGKDCCFLKKTWKSSSLNS
jgi:hypothetical protein